MYVGLIVHSFTGNTRSVAERIRERLLANGHTVSLEEVVLVNEDPQSPSPITLASAPATAKYDAVVFAGPVRGMSASPAMQSYIPISDPLEGKPVRVFVTHYFPFAWMGGTRSADQLAEMATSRGGTVVGKGVINWTSRKRERDIESLLETFSRW